MLSSGSRGFLSAQFMMIQHFLGMRRRSSTRGGARQQLATDLANVGSELRGQGGGARNDPEDRAQIPEGIKQLSATWTDPVTGVQQVGFGIVDCGIPFGDNTFPRVARRVRHFYLR
jgi:hypothetical protein